MSNLCCHCVSINMFCHCNMYRALWLRGQYWYSKFIVVKLLHIKISRIGDVKRDFKCQTPGPHWWVWIPMRLIWIKSIQLQTAGLFFRQGLETFQDKLWTFYVHLMHILNWNDETYDVDILNKAVEFDPIWQRASLSYQSVTTSNRDRLFLELFVSINLIFSELNGKRLLVDKGWALMSSCMPTELAWRSCECFLKMKHGSCAPWSLILASPSFT